MHGPPLLHKDKDARQGVCNVDDDSIGDAAAMMLDAIEECAGQPHYRDPILAARIKRVCTELEELQLHIDSLTDAGEG